MSAMTPPPRVNASPSTVEKFHDENLWTIIALAYDMNHAAGLGGERWSG